MRIHVFLLFLLIFVSTNTNTGNSISSVYNNLNGLARIADGLVLQSDIISSSSSNTNACASLLNADPTKLANMITLKVENLRDEMTRISQVVAKTSPKKLEDSGKLEAAIQGIHDMTNSLEAIHMLSASDPTIQYRAQIDKFYREFPNWNLDSIDAGFTVNLEQALSQILESSDSDNDSKRQSRMKTLSAEVANIQSEIDKLTSSLDPIKKVFTLIGQHGNMEQVMKVSRIAEEYLKNMQTFVELPGKLDQVKSLVNGLSGIASDHKSMELLGSGLEGLVAQLNTSGSTGTLTMGFANGISDLEMIMKDVKSSDWVKKVLAGGKDTNKLLTHLNPLEKFTEGMRRLETSWRNITDPAAVKTLGSLATALREAADSGKVAAGKDLLASIATVQTCITGLLPVTNSPDFKGFSKVFQFSQEFDASFRVFQGDISDVLKLEAINSPAFAQKIIAEVNSAGSKGDAKAQVDFVKTIEGIKSFRDQLRTVYNKLKKYSTGKTLMTQPPPSWLPIESVRTSLNGTNLDTVLDCLKNKKFDAAEIKSLIKFQKDTQGLKSQESSMSTSSKNLGSAMKVQKEFSDLMKLSGRTRRRRDTVKTLQISKTFRTAAKDLGNGVRLLGELEKVRKEGKKVGSVAKSDSGTDVMIRGMVGMASVWTDENKQKMLDLVKAVEDLNVKCANYSDQDIVQLGHVFDDAARIQGVQVDSRLFNDPVFKTLSAAKHPLAPDFLTVSHLNLDYSASLLPMTVASGSLLNIRQFFDDFFGIVRVLPGGMATSASEPPKEISKTWEAWHFGLIGCFVFLLVVCLLLGLFIWALKRDHLLLKRMIMKRDEYDALVKRLSVHLYFQEPLFISGNRENLLEAVKANDFASAKGFLLQGSWVNRKDESGRSLLEVAIIASNLKLIKLLVSFGANTGTCVQYIDGILANGESKDVRRRSDLMAIRKFFIKNANKSYQRMAPRQLAVNLFKLFFLNLTELAEKFSKKFPDMMTDNLIEATHIIVSSNDAFAVDPKDICSMLIPLTAGLVVKSSWIQESMKSSKALTNFHLYQIDKFTFQGEVHEMKNWKNERNAPTCSALHGQMPIVHPWPENHHMMFPQSTTMSSELLKQLLDDLIKRNLNFDDGQAHDGNLNVWMSPYVMMTHEIRLITARGKHQTIQNFVGEMYNRKFQ